MKTTISICFIVFSSAVVVSVAYSGDANNIEAPAIVPHPEIQAQISKAVETLYRVSENGTTNVTVIEYYAELDALRAVAEKDSSALMLQIVYYLQHAKGMRDGMGGEMLLGTLPELKNGRLLGPLVPYLGSQDPDLQKVLKRLISRIEDRQVSREPDFSLYQGYLRAFRSSNTDIPKPLVDQMFRSSPSHALLAFMRVYENDPVKRRELRWTENLIRQAIWKQDRGFLDAANVPPEVTESLAVLLNHEHWWVRRYATELLHQKPTFNLALEGYENPDPNIEYPVPEVKTVPSKRTDTLQPKPQPDLATIPVPATTVVDDGSGPSGS